MTGAGSYGQLDRQSYPNSGVILLSFTFPLDDNLKQLLGETASRKFQQRKLVGRGFVLEVK